MTISPVSQLQAATIIVDPTAGKGNYTTIQAAINAASSGQTILIKPGTYTENPALKAGVNLTALTGDGETPNVTISGSCTFSSAGTVTISNIKLITNGSTFLTVSGSAASIVNLDSCSLFPFNNTGIFFTSSSASAILYIKNCVGNTTGTGTYFSMSSPGYLQISYSILGNGNSVTTNSALSAGLVNIFHSIIQFPITSSGTASFGAIFTQFQMSVSTNALTLGGSGLQAIDRCGVNAINNIAIVCNTAVHSNLTSLFSLAAAAVTGAGAFTLTNLTMEGQVKITAPIGKNSERHGQMLSSTQPAFLAYLSSTANNTIGNGAGTTYTVGTDLLTILYDQDGNITTGGVFTAPFTGIYYFFAQVVATGCTVATGMTISCVTTAKTYTNTYGRTAGAGDLSAQVIVNAPMTVGDTATWTVFASGEAAASDDIVGSASPQTYVMGYLIC